MVPKIKLHHPLCLYGITLPSQSFSSVINSTHGSQNRANGVNYDYIFTIYLFEVCIIAYYLLVLFCVFCLLFFRTRGRWQSHHVFYSWQLTSKLRVYIYPFSPKIRISENSLCNRSQTETLNCHSYNIIFQGTYWLINDRNKRLQHFCDIKLNVWYPEVIKISC